MSFTTEIKNEVSLIDFPILDEVSMLSGFVRNNGIKSDKEINLQLENPKIARKLISLFKEIFDVNVNVTQINKVNFSKKVILNLNIVDKVPTILRDLMVNDMNGAYLDVPYDYFIDGEDKARSYLRGAFLASGSINDPKTSRYHLEFLVDHKSEALFIVKLLALFLINAKVITRDKGYMVYVKEAEKIGDFLRIISANRAVMYYEDIRIYRDHKNMTNRLNNCEQANVDKTIDAANRQMEDIDVIVNKLGLDLVDDKLKEVIIYRQKYPEVSLNELSEIISLETDKVLTKSGLSHRLRKIHELAERVRNNKIENEKE